MVKISNLQIKMPRDLIMKKHELDINLCQLCKRIIHFAATEMTLKVRSYEKISLKLVNQRNCNCETTEDPIWTYATQKLRIEKSYSLVFLSQTTTTSGVQRHIHDNADNNRTGQQHITMICLNTNKTVNMKRNYH